MWGFWTFLYKGVFGSGEWECKGLTSSLVNKCERSKNQKCAKNKNKLERESSVKVKKFWRDLKKVGDDIGLEKWRLDLQKKHHGLNEREAAIFKKRVYEKVD